MRLHLGLALGHKLPLLPEADRFAIHPEGHSSPQALSYQGCIRIMQLDEDEIARCAGAIAGTVHHPAWREFDRSSHSQSLADTPAYVH